VSDMQFFALSMMLLVGMFGLPVYLESEYERKHKATRIAGAVWIAVWWLPPLAMLWIKGVFG
jgi:hypothetical protein